MKLPEPRIQLTIQLPDGASPEQVEAEIRKAVAQAVDSFERNMRELARQRERESVIPGDWVAIASSTTEMVVDDVVVSEPLAKLKRFRPRMFELLEQMARVQTRKAGEYAKESNPYSNYEQAGAAIGVPGWKYVEARIAEKQARHVELVNKDLLEVAEGGYAESAIDRANCCLIALVMYEKDQNSK